MWLWTSLGWAAPPEVTCEDVEVTVPAEPETIRRPAGFQWEGFRPLATLADGRTVLLRGAALEGLSRSALKRQHDEDGPDRVMQVVLLSADDKLQNVATLPRGTPLEVVATPDGGLVLARTRQAVTVLDYLRPDGSFARTTSLAENPQGDKEWRRASVIRQNGEPRVAPFGDGRVVLWWSGTGSAIDLNQGTTLGRTEVWPQGLVRVFDRKGDTGEVLVVDRQQRLSWYNLKMERVLTEDCVGCRVTTLGPSLEGPRRDRRALAQARPALAAILRPQESSAEVVWRGLSDGSADRGVSPVTWTPDVPGPFTWMSRPGPGDSLIVAANAPGRAQVVALRPGVSKPVWSYQTALEPGERVIADGLDQGVRVRVLTSPEGEEEVVTRVLLASMAGKVSDWVDPVGLEPDLRAALSAPAAESRWSDGKPLRVPGDPEMERMPPGPSTAKFQRCTWEIR
jgi:hypothetical protein